MFFAHTSLTPHYYHVKYKKLGCTNLMLAQPPIKLKYGHNNAKSEILSRLCFCPEMARYVNKS
uniref:Putative ovule protein n=1 Tax=Solanum chacoense TaxID=4108 RepID=A0A0V0H935_SOLCH